MISQAQVEEYRFSRSMNKKFLLIFEMILRFCWFNPIAPHICHWSIDLCPSHQKNKATDSDGRNTKDHKG